MVVTENTLKWAIRLYPPLFLQRIWVVKFDKGFRGVEVKIVKSWLNTNHNKAIFGGTLFAAADPFFPILLRQVFTHKGYHIIAWSKSSEIRYLKPSYTNMYFKIALTEDEIQTAERILITEGKYVNNHTIDILNISGEVCVSMRNEVYIRDLNFKG